MLTPKFRLEQDDKFVFAFIDTPYVKYSEVDIHMENNVFTFFCKPYHLRLFLSGEITENGQEVAKFDVEKGQFLISIPKVNQGEEFSDLDMLTKLMIPMKCSEKVKAGALIEVLESGQLLDCEREDNDIDWMIAQEMCDMNMLTNAACSYGFNNTTTGLFTHRQEEMHELLDLSSPDTTSHEERKKLEKIQEASNFSSDHYLADFYEDDHIVDILVHEAEWNKLYHDLCNVECVDSLVQYDQNENDQLLKLPKKEYLLDTSQEKAIYIGLVDLLYGCLYDMRVNLGEISVESAWTIRKLSPTLSCLVMHSNLRCALLSSMRRSLCFPLYRHWILAMKVLDDIRIVLLLGKKMVLKLLLRIQHVFNNTEAYHILNDLYVTDYCVWIQTASPKRLTSLAKTMKKMSFLKSDVELNLDILEYASWHSTDSSAETEDSEENSIAEVNESDNLSKEKNLDHVEHDSISRFDNTIDLLVNHLEQKVTVSNEESKTPLIEVLDRE